MDNNNTIQAVKLKLTDGREITYSGPIQITQEDVTKGVGVVDATFSEGKELPEGMKWVKENQETKLPHKSYFTNTGY